MSLCSGQCWDKRKKINFNNESSHQIAHSPTSSCTRGIFLFFFFSSLYLCSLFLSTTQRSVIVRLCCQSRTSSTCLSALSKKLQKRLLTVWDCSSASPLCGSPIGSFTCQTGLWIVVFFFFFLFLSPSQLDANFNTCYFKISAFIFELKGHRAGSDSCGV